MRAILRCLVVCSLAASVVASQQTPVFRARVDLVQVDVVVVDAAGKPITGLTAADFTVLDRRKPVEIAAFEEISHAVTRTDSAPAPPTAVRRDVASNREAMANRVIILVVDDLHIWRGRTDRAKEIARTIVTTLGADASMAVLFTSRERGTQVTEDRSILLDAIARVQGRQSVRRPNDAVDNQKAPRIDPDTDTLVALEQVSAAGNVSLQHFYDNLSQYETLREAARMLGTNDARRKAFVLVSEGIGKDLTGIFGFALPGMAAPQGGLEYATTGDAAATMKTETPPYHELSLLAMMDAMRRANVATYAIDPRGAVSSAELAQECMPPPPGFGGGDPCSNGLTDWHSPLRLAQHGLAITAEASGGLAVTNSDDFTGGIRQIVSDLDHYYMLGFYPADSGGKGYRPLDVKVNRPGAVLRFRHGYQPGPPPAPPKNTDAVVALAVGVLPKTDLPLRVSALPFPGRGKDARVAVALEVTAPTQPLVDPDAKLRDTLRYDVIVVDEKKAKVKTVTGLEGRVTLSAARPGQGAMPPTVAYQVASNVELPPGRYQLRVAALSAKLGLGGSVYLDVEIPDFTGRPLALSGLVVGYAGGARVAAAPAGSVPVFPFPPSLDRVFDAADTLRVACELVDRTGNRAGGPARPLSQARIALVDATDRVVKSVERVEADARGQIDTTIPLTGLERGGYRLRVTVGDGRNSAEREIGIAIR